jgi:hypothetical protein
MPDRGVLDTQGRARARGQLPLRPMGQPGHAEQRATVLGQRNPRVQMDRANVSDSMTSPDRYLAARGTMGKAGSSCHIGPAGGRPPGIVRRRERQATDAQKAGAEHGKEANTCLLAL